MVIGLVQRGSTLVVPWASAEASAVLDTVDVEQHLVRPRIAKSATWYVRGSCCVSVCCCSRALRLPCAALVDCSDRMPCSTAEHEVDHPCQITLLRQQMNVPDSQ